MLTASRALPPFPHICVLFAGFQLILVAWFAGDHPPENPTYDIGLDTGNYLSYTIPLWLAYTIGWFSPLWRAAAQMQRLDAICARTGDLLKRHGCTSSCFQVLPSPWWFLLLMFLPWLSCWSWLQT